MKEIKTSTIKKIIDLSKKPEKVASYTFGDIVTRENFINFLILSYSFSRGNFIIQKIFFTLMEKKDLFVYESTIENLYKNGSFDTLTPEEQNLFVNAFIGVKKHLEIFIEMEIPDEIKDEFDGLYDRPKNDGLATFTAALDFFNFDEIDSANDFIKVASDFNKRFKNSLN